MVAIYLDTEEELKTRSQCTEVRARLYVCQLLALAASLLERWAGYTPRINGVLMYDDTIFMNAFRNVLEQCLAFQARSGTGIFHNAPLWALYVGSLTERGTVSERQPESQRWFNVRLASLASTTGIVSWDQLKHILKGFIYEESLMSQGSVWFQELVATQGKQRETPTSANHPAPSHSTCPSQHSGIPS
jgi:hypothetical protein